MNKFLNSMSVKNHFALWPIVARIYDDLGYRFMKIVSRTDFSDHFRKIILRCKRISYNSNVMCSAVSSMLSGLETRSLGRNTIGTMKSSQYVQVSHMSTASRV